MGPKYIICWVMAVIGLLFITGCAGQGTQVQNTPISASDLAKCLAANGAKVYGASSCSHCQDQKALFGEDWKLVNYIECEAPEDPNAQKDECMRAGITAYPTWVFKDGQVKQGFASMDELAQMSECKSPIAAPSVPITDEEVPEDQIGTELAIEQTPVEDAAKSEEESPTYQIDMDITFEYLAPSGLSGYSEHTVLHTTKTLKNIDVRTIEGIVLKKFSGDFYDESHPIQVSTDGFSTGQCFNDYGDYSIRGDFSESYNGNVRIDLVYREAGFYSNQPSPELIISFSQIENLPRPEFETKLSCPPTTQEVSASALDNELNTLLDATTRIDSQMEYLSEADHGTEAQFSSIDGGTIDLSGPMYWSVGEPSQDHTFSGKVTVRRIG